MLRVTAGITVLTMIGAAWALVRGSYNASKVKELRENNDDLRADNDDKDARIADRDALIEAHKLKEHALSVELQGMRNEVDLLTRLVTQRAEVEEVHTVIEAVLDELKRHHKASLEEWHHVNEAFNMLLQNNTEDEG
jgi:hypothetical protein